MSALIKPIGMLKSYIGGQAEIAVEAGRTVREALAALGMPPEIVALVLVNDERQSKDYFLQDGDVVKLAAVVGGGQVANGQHRSNRTRPQDRLWLK
jgi:sulfur carrier protein ThiS